jgi:DNA helicase-2/ATP-dependent DNA helicase PcrA
MADEWEYKSLVRSTLARRAQVNVKTLDLLVREMAANWESLCPHEDPSVDATVRARFLGAWNEHRQVYGYTLLDELPYDLRAALRDHPDLEGVDYDLLIVDEYQDLNACDLEVLRLVAARGCSVVSAGDDDQSIYSFRKAAPEGIRRFLDDYPGSSDYPLSVTQRCGRRIVDWATYVIEGDPDRPSGRLRLRSAAGSPEGEVALLSFEDERSEAEGIALLVQRLRDQDEIPPGEILVLLRSDHNGSFSTPIKEHRFLGGICG